MSEHQYRPMSQPCSRRCRARTPTVGLSKDFSILIVCIAASPLLRRSTSREPEQCCWQLILPIRAARAALFGSIWTHEVLHIPETSVHSRKPPNIISTATYSASACRTLSTTLGLVLRRGIQRSSVSLIRTSRRRRRWCSRRARWW